jgi:tetratricopeptide (TPR) repeat protein
MSELFREIEPLLADQPEPLGAMCYAQAKMAEHLGDDEEAKRIVVQSLRYYELTQDRNAIGRALINVAHYEFKTRQYVKAKVHLEKAILCVEDDLHTRLIAEKEYAKALIKLGDLQKAEEVIKDALLRLKPLNRPDVEGKFYVLLAIATDSCQFAEQICSQKKYGARVRHLACLYLIDYYKRMDDASSLLRYYRYAEELVGTDSELLHKGDL